MFCQHKYCTHWKANKRRAGRIQMNRGLPPAAGGRARQEWRSSCTVTAVSLYLSCRMCIERHGMCVWGGKHPALIAHLSVQTLQVKTLKGNAYSCGSSVFSVQNFSREMFGKRKEWLQLYCKLSLKVSRKKNICFPSTYNFRTWEGKGLRRLIDG